MLGTRLRIALVCLLAAGVVGASPAAQLPDEEAEEQERREDEATEQDAGQDAEQVLRPEAVPVPGVPEAPVSEPLSPGDIQIRADEQSREGGHYKARGFVDLRAGDTRIQADQLDLYETKNDDGVATRRLEAEGNVVFMRGEERLAGDRLTLDLDTNQGRFENAIGYVEPGVFIEGKLIERVDATTYKIKGGHFTSCSQPNPRWSFSAASATIQLHDKIKASHVIFKVKKVPALYIPYLLYPIRADQRSTGLLFPHFGYSSERGFNLGTGFFWAMGRSTDQTLYADSYSKFGQGLGHELRYLRRGASRGTFRSYVFHLAPELRESTGQEWDYDIDWAATQELPGKIRGTVNARLFSDIGFQQRMGENLNTASTRRQRAVVNLRRSFGATQIELMADTNETVFTGRDVTRINRHLPTLGIRRSPRKIGRTGIVFAYEASIERLARGDQDHLDEYSRFDLAPQLSRPFSTSFLQVTPRVALRYTRWDASIDEEEGDVSGPGLDRRFFETSVQVRGPNFSRVFHDLGVYSNKIKHVIGPEVTWSYRTRVDDFDQIPRFDGTDYHLGTNQLRYALVNRLLAKRPGKGGKERTVEFLNWRIDQTYYVQIKEGQNDYDPNYSASAFGPGGVPSHYSPVRSRLRLKPGQGFTSNFNLEYDVNFKQLRNLSVGSTVSFPGVRLNANWSRRKRVTDVEEDRVVTSDFLRGRVTLTPVKGIQFDGSADYDILRENLLQVRGRLRLGVQCCAVMAEMIQYEYNQRSEREIRFSIELENVGSFGNFMDEGGPRSGRGRY